MYQPTNADLQQRMEQRLDAMEAKLDHIENIVQRATGMWVLSKWVAATLLGLAAFLSYLHDWFPPWGKQ